MRLGADGHGHAFAKDCCDREVVARRAWEGKGLPGEPVREMLIEAVEQRFGAVDAIPQGYTLEFLTDNGGAYVAHDTRHIAHSLGLTPVNTPVCSPQSNRPNLANSKMAEQHSTEISLEFISCVADAALPRHNICRLPRTKKPGSVGRREKWRELGRPSKTGR